MQTRIEFFDLSTDRIKALLGVAKVVDKSALETALKHLVKIRASQINACAFCLDSGARVYRHGNQQTFLVLPNDVSFSSMSAATKG